jgi:hypothetical protein
VAPGPTTIGLTHPPPLKPSAAGTEGTNEKRVIFDKTEALLKGWWMKVSRDTFTRTVFLF